jgi:hypothetical protein
MGLRKGMMKLALLFVGAVLLALPAFGAADPPRSAAAESGSETLVATVRSFDPASGTLSLLTGRGHALRVVQVALPPGTGITRMGIVFQPSDLKPGAIVRVRFGPERARGNRQASRVEVQAGEP